MRSQNVLQLQKALADSEARGAKQAAAIVRLEKEIASYRRPRRSTRNHAVFRFLDLPAEMRDMVYSLCVSMGKVFPRPRKVHDTRYEQFETYSKPERALLCVNRQVRVEAVKVLCLTNQIVLSYECDGWCMLLQKHSTAWPPYRARLTSLPTLMGQYLSSVSITLDIRGVTSDPLDLASLVRSECDDAFMDDKIEDTFGDEWTVRAHDTVGSFTGQWDQICQAVAVPSLRTLQVNIENCYCPLGCCRLVFDATVALRDIHFHERLQTIEILGALSPEERERIVEVLTKLRADGNPAPVLQLASPILRFRAPKERPGLALDWIELDADLKDDEVDLASVVQEKMHGRTSALQSSP